MDGNFCISCNILKNSNSLLIILLFFFFFFKFQYRVLWKHVDTKTILWIDGKGKSVCFLKIPKNYVNLIIGKIDQNRFEIFDNF